MRKPQNAAPPPRYTAEEYCHVSPAALARTLAAFGFTRRLITAARIGTPLWYEATLRTDGLRAEIADWLVLLMHGAALPVTWICSVSGDWMDSSGGAKGRGLVSLGAFAWRVTVEAATARLMSLHGYRRGHNHAAS
jgi:hypothetical protein